VRREEYPNVIVEHYVYADNEEGWRGFAFNYKYQIIQDRLVYFIRGTDEKRVMYIYNRLKKQISSYSWSRWTEERDGQAYYCIELFENRLLDVPKGYMYHFPLEDALTDDSLHEVLLMPNIDDHIRDVLIYFNLLGFKTISSCSGLLEDHIDDTKEESYPFIMFTDKRYAELISDIIVDTDWKLDTDRTSPVIILDSEDDNYIKEQWSILRDRLKVLLLVAYKDELRSLPEPLATKNWWMPRYGIDILY